ncbi:MAG TPA: DNA methyltransferase [Candidatus Bathyarchaeia archaeon]|nr:DNA methyltransferase [Candidatus Bathyarchaeia archaeon]
MPGSVTALKNEILKVRPEKSSAIYDMAVYLANKPYNIAQMVIEQLTEPGQIVLEPFLGSGVTLVEALRVGRKAVGVDINPYSIIISRASLRDYDVDEYKKLVDQVVAKTEQKINSLYLTVCDDCGRREGVITRAEFSDQKLDFVRYYCRFDQRIPHRKRGKEPKTTLRQPPKRSDSEATKSYEKVDYKVSAQAQKIADTKLVQNGRLNIKSGERIRDLFSGRNLLATSLLYDAIWKLPDSPKNELMKFTFLSGIHLMKYTDYKSNSQATYYRPKVRLLERNVLEVFLDRVELILKGREEYDAELKGKCKEVKTVQELKSSKGTFLLKLGSSKNLTDIFPTTDLMSIWC